MSDPIAGAPTVESCDARLEEIAHLPVDDQVAILTGDVHRALGRLVYVMPTDHPARPLWCALARQLEP